MIARNGADGSAESKSAADQDMMQIDLDKLDEQVGRELGVSPWLDVTQGLVDEFAKVTRDDQYIHVDPERAAETIFGGTIAHGFLVLSMLSYFSNSGMGISLADTKMSINYGFDKVRFLCSVRVGSRIRGRSTLKSVQHPRPDQVRICQDVVVECEGEEKPALVAEWITLVVR
jgi:acyl dehydratase